MGKNDFGLFFKGVQKIARMALPRYYFETTQSQDEPVVYVSHHQNMIGPISILVWLKYYIRTWGLSEFTEQEACYNHYVDFTFTKRFGWPKWLAKMIAWPVSYLVPWLAQSADIIPVYRGSRKVVKTMQISNEALLNGENLLIFPDIDYSSSSTETSNIYEGFLHLEKKYFKETNKHLSFVPIFSDRKNKVVRVGKEIRFSGTEKFLFERKEIADKIKEELNRLSQANEKEIVHK